MNDPSLAARIDHTLLKAEATSAQVDAVVAEALEHGFASVCVNGVYLPRVVEALAAGGGSDAGVGGGDRPGVKSCAVAGFPLGAMSRQSKAAEAAALARAGAQEIDFVAHLPYLLDQDESSSHAEFAEVVAAVRLVDQSVTIKVILETACLMEGVSDEVAEARVAAGCRAAVAAGCDFVKTSTGFHPAGGATAAAVRLLKRHAPGLQVKASGGIRTADDARQMIDAGADRLGCSAGVAIVTGGRGTSGY